MSEASKANIIHSLKIREAVHAERQKVYEALPMETRTILPYVIEQGLYRWKGPFTGTASVAERIKRANR